MNRYDLLALFFPNRCLVCGEYAGPREFTCAHCRGVKPVKRIFHIQAGKELHCLEVWSALPNEGYTNRCIDRFKFSGKTAYARKFMGLALARLNPEMLCSYDAVSFVPMLEQARRRRGYNQAELLAKVLAKELGIPCVSLLKKKKTRAAQHVLTAKERKENVKGAFEPVCDRIGQNILLVDDIITTGATMCQCAAVLYKAGAVQVLGICGVDTPLDVERNAD